MDQALKDVFAEYDARMAKEAELFRGAANVNVDDLLLPVGPVVGQFMHTLVTGLKAKVIVELGTSYGYSAHWLADAARQSGGKVFTMDVAAHKQDYAKERLTRAGLAGHVEFMTGDAVAMLKDFGQPIDFVLLDIWKDLYLPCLEAFFPKLADGAVVVADNMINPVAARKDADAYRAAVRAKPGIESVLLPLGNGVELSRKAG